MIIANVSSTQSLQSVGSVFSVRPPRGQDLTVGASAGSGQLVQVPVVRVLYSAYMRTLLVALLTVAAVAHGAANLRAGKHQLALSCCSALLCMGPNISR